MVIRCVCLHSCLCACVHVLVLCHASIMSDIGHDKILPAVELGSAGCKCGGANFFYGAYSIPRMEHIGKIVAY